LTTINKDELIQYVLLIVHDTLTNEPNGKVWPYL